MKLYGGLIGWRTNKQDIVITLTTEAELLAFSYGVKEERYISKLLSELQMKFKTPITVYCDNQ